MSPPRLALCLAFLLGCRATVNHAVRGRVVPALVASRDVEMACEFGVVTTGAVLALSARPAEDGLTISGLASGVCAERQAWEEELSAMALLSDLADPGRVALARDHQVRARRLRTLAAARFQDSWLAARGHYGDHPPESEAKQGVYLVGMLAGALALVNDSAGGGARGVPQNQLLDVARGTEGLDDARWWGVPSALRGAAWVVVPGSAPEGVDPWALLEAAAGTGDAAGQGVPRALLVFALANAGRTDALAERVAARDGAAVAEWPLLDAYAEALVQFELDKLWIQATGHRAEREGELPPSAEEIEDPFGEEPAPPQEGSAG